jgi:hypothetical protein
MRTFESKIRSASVDDYLKLADFSFATDQPLSEELRAEIAAYLKANHQRSGAIEIGQKFRMLVASRPTEGRIPPSA